MTQDKTNNKIDFLNIDSDSNYFDTREQVKIRSVQWFVETTEPSIVSGSNVVAGLFSRKRIIKDDVVYNSTSYLTSSTSIDPSGNDRRILDGRNDYYASSSLDVYRNGVEITQEKHWAAGLAKITAGTPGHLYQSTLFGVSDVSIISADRFIELDPFDPIAYVASGGDMTRFTYPIITSDANQIENLILNGIIEPFPIRPVISNFSINFPFEPQAIRGALMTGNERSQFSSEEIVSVYEFSPKKQNAEWQLDASKTSIVTGSSDFTLTTVQEYTNLSQNTSTPFEDVVLPRGQKVTDIYGEDLFDIVYRMPQQDTTYINTKQKTGTCGMVYDNTPEGTDSIAYGGLLY